jgi:hypothetical protein
MKKFIGKTLAFLVILALLVSGLLVLSSVNESCNQFFAYISCSEDYQRQTEEISVLQRVQQQDNAYDKIMVGDSVCYMLFTRLQDVNDAYFLGGNTRPCTMVMQYVLAKEFMEGHPDAKEVYLFLSKDSWESTIDVQCGYSYVVVPQTQAGTMKDLDEDTVLRMQQLFGRFLMNPYVVNVFDHSLMNHKLVLNGLMVYHELVLGEDMSATYERTENEISPLALQYFEKLVALCEEQGVQLHLLHDPLADTEEKHQEVAMEEEMFRQAGIYDDFSEYFSSVLYYPPEDFFDGVHFNVDDELDNQVIRDIQDHTGLLQDFVVE